MTVAARLVAGVLVALGLVAGTRPAEVADDPRAPVMRALLVGVSDYPTLRAALEGEASRSYDTEYQLHGPSNDVALLRDVLIRRLGASPDHVRELVTGESRADADLPTRERILEELADLADRSGHDDLVVVFLAGHGTQQPSRTSDEEEDGQDEVFLPMDAGLWDDGEHEIQNAITDDELGAAIDQIADKGARVWLIVDSCCSGTMLRGVGSTARAIPPSFLGVPERPRRRGAASRAAPVARVGRSATVAMYAAESDEPTLERPLPKGAPGAEVHGQFSFMVARQLARLGPDATYEELFAAVVGGYRAQGWSRPRPSIEGAVDSRIADGGRVGPRLAVSEVDGEIVLNAGRLDGIEPGTRLRVFDGNPRGDRATPIGEVRVEEVSLLESFGALVEGSEMRLGPVPLPAEVIVAPVASHRIRLHVPGASEGTTRDDEEQVARAVRSLGHRVVIADETDADWTFVVKPLPMIVPREGPERAIPIERGRTLEEGLTMALRRVWRFENLCRIGANPVVERTAESLSVEVVVADHAGERRLRPGERVAPGSWLQLQVDHRATRSAEVWAFAFDRELHPTQVFPPLMEMEKAGFEGPAVRVGDRILVTDSPVGGEVIVVVLVPPGTRGMESLAAREPELPTVRSGMTPVEALLEDLRYGKEGPTRGSVAVPSGDSIGVALISYEVQWPRPLEPLGSRAKAIDGDERTAGAPPDPWAGADDLEWRAVSTRDGDQAAYLRGESGGVVLIDLDADTSLSETATKTEVRAARDRRAFDMELALVFESSRVTVLYDLDGDRVFDLASVDDGLDGRADVTFLRVTGGEWTATGTGGGPWLSVSALGASALRIVECVLAELGGDEDRGEPVSGEGPGGR